MLQFICRCKSFYNAKGSQRILCKFYFSQKKISQYILCVSHFSRINQKVVYCSGEKASKPSFDSIASKEMWLKIIMAITISNYP